MNILIGCVERVGSKREAQQLLKKYPDVAGAIWEDKIDLPVLTADQISYLTRSNVVWTREQGISVEYAQQDAQTPICIDALTPYFEMAANDILIANECKGDIAKRKHWFLNDDDLDARAHFHPKARNIWAHRHLEGSGLIVFCPIGNKPLEVRVGPRTHDIVKEVNLKQLFAAGLIRSFELNENDVMLFNQNLLHKSNKGHRFRGALNGREI